MTFKLEKISVWLNQKKSRRCWVRIFSHRLFKNVSVQDSRQNLDNYLIIGYLHSATLR